MSRKLSLLAHGIYGVRVFVAALPSLHEDRSSVPINMPLVNSNLVMILSACRSRALRLVAGTVNDNVQTSLITLVTA